MPLGDRHAARRVAHGHGHILRRSAGKMDEHGSKKEPGRESEVEAGEIPEDSAMDESSRLRELHADVRNQDDLERDITRQVSLSTTHGLRVTVD